MPALWFDQAGILALAAALDGVLGDPWGWPHPVQGMGWVIHHASQRLIKASLSPAVERVAGIFLGMGLIVGSGLAGWLLIAAARAIHPVAGWGLEVILVASCFAGRSLRRAAEDVLAPYRQQDLDRARQRLGLYVGRDTEELSADEILRAVLETVSENATDGVFAPLFYGGLGAIIGVGAAPLALAYKAASTLDSMVGYREAPYTYLGWFSARLEDGLTWLPCRLVVLTIGLLSRRPWTVWRICWRDAAADPSPNAGWSECAYAAALGVQLGGTNRYRGVLKAKPKLGDAHWPITPERIQKALQFNRYGFLIWLVTLFVLLTGLAYVH